MEIIQLAVVGIIIGATALGSGMLMARQVRRAYMDGFERGYLKREDGESGLVDADPVDASSDDKLADAQPDDAPGQNADLKRQKPGSKGWAGVLV